ncbi:TPA: phage DNA ejection protein [Enterobacter ludwigii]
MAIGSRYNAGADNYLSMANQADQAAINEAKGMVSLFESGYSTMSKMKDRQRLDEARQAFEAAWSSGNPEDVQRVIARFPEYGAQLQKALGVRDEQNRQQMGSLAIQLSGMLESGNIEGAQTLLRNNPALFDKQGMFSAESVADAIGRAATGTDADSAKRLAMWKDWAQKLSLSILKPNEIMNYGLSQQQMAQQLEMQKNALEQQLQVANDRLGLGYAQLASMQEHRQNMLNRPTPTMMNWEFLQSLSPEQQKQFLTLMPGGGAGKSGMPLNPQIEGEGVISTFDRTIGTIDNILGSEGFSAAIGAKGLTNYLPGTSAQTTKALVETLKSQTFLNEIEKMKGMGALSEKEGEKLSAAVGALNLDMPEADFAKSLREIKDYMSKGRERAARKYGIVLPPEPVIEQKPKGLIHPTVQGMAEASGYTSPSGVPYKVK